MKKIISVLLVLVLVLSMAACGNNAAVDTTPSTVAPTEATPAESEAAALAFNVTVVDVDGSETNFQYTSSAATVGEALLDAGLIAGEDSEWGLMVDTVNGISADWETEKAYWAFYIGEEYAQTGVDATEITAGIEYRFVKTISEE